MFSNIQYASKLKWNIRNPQGYYFHYLFQNGNGIKEGIDFLMGLPSTTRGYYVIWVIVDCLTKSAHFLPIKKTYPLNRFARIYIEEIVKLHGVPSTIVSDRDPRFTSHFWEALHEALES